MKNFIPNCCRNFSCKAASCRHSCCIGWEIDIDEATYAYYRSVSGDLGVRLRNNINEENGVPHFCLAENERCPFLNSDNLCDIFINLGEARLCSICSDHPRYRNYIAGRCETGFGLCCEAAGELILGQKEPAKWVQISEDDEAMPEITEWEDELLSRRAEIIAIIQNRTKAVDDRVAELLEMSGQNDIWLGRSIEDWRELYIGLERLDENWSEKLALLTKENAVWKDRYDSCWENLLVYFVNRHVTNAADEWELAARTVFAVLGYAVIRTMLNAETSSSFDDIVELSRMYSAEIEYSEENTDTLLEEIMYQL